MGLNRPPHILNWVFSHQPGAFMLGWSSWWHIKLKLVPIHDCGLSPQWPQVLAHCLLSSQVALCPHMHLQCCHAFFNHHVAFMPGFTSCLRPQCLGFCSCGSLSHTDKLNTDGVFSGALWGPGTAFMADGTPPGLCASTIAGLAALAFAIMPVGPMLVAASAPLAPVPPPPPCEQQLSTLQTLPLPTLQPTLRPAGGATHACPSIPHLACASCGFAPSHLMFPFGTIPIVQVFRPA